MFRKRKLLSVSVTVLMALSLAVSAFAAGDSPRRDFTEAPEAPTQSEYVTVILTDPPAAQYEGGIGDLKRTKPERGQKLDPTDPAVQAYLDHLSGTHQDFRDWLASKAPRAEIVREYSLVANGFGVKLNGTRANVLKNGPGVSVVAFSTLHQPTMNVSTELIGASALWAEVVGGQAKAGEGVEVGIIDTGIDVTNDFFDDEVYDPVDQTDECPDQDLDPDTPNTNNKVIVCRVYTSGVAPGAAGEQRALFFDHGTHVAGTVAGNPNTTGDVVVTPDDPETDENERVVVSISGLSGVAPKAWLGNYNVFPGFGAGFVAFGGSAFSHDIIAALEDTVGDGMDVVNMSLGGGVDGPHDTLSEAVNATVDAGLVVAVAAGNSGPGDATVESPGNAANALTAGASTNPHFIGIDVSGTKDGNGAFSFGAALGDFENFVPAITADYTVTDPANGCDTITTNLTGKIALIDRGACFFTTKIQNAKDAGAEGVLVVNNVAGDPVAMAHAGGPLPTIPAAMVGKAEGNGIKPTGSVTVDGTVVAEIESDNEDIIAGFSSRGPTPFNYLIKPDATAPGVNVVSSVFDNEFAFFQGTSMATPHLAGSAALLLQLHDGWSPSDVKSAIVNTANRPVFDHVNGTDPVGVLTRGGGRVDLEAANATPLTIDPVSASFGLWEGNKPVSATLDLSIRNVSGSAQSCSVAVTGSTDNDGNPIVTAPNLVSVAKDGTATLTLTLDAGRSDRTSSGDYSGDVSLTCGSTELLVPWWVRIDRGAATP